MSDGSLKDKTIKGVGWSAIETIARMGVTFLISVILARLLSPEEYGLIGILTIFISIFNTIVDGGFSYALIRKKDATDVEYSTVFYLNLVLSFLLAAILFLCAKPIAIFFERSELVILARVMSCVVIINAFTIVQRALVNKAIDFKTQTKITLISSIFSGLIGIFLAYMGCGVWALVWQQIVNQLLSAILYWRYNKWVPKLLFSWASFREMWNFSSKLLAGSIIDTVWKEVFQVVIGKYYSPVTLGLYTRAKQFSDLCSVNITSIVQRVSYPVFSTIQEERERLKLAYKKVIRTTMLPTFVLMLGLAACSESLIFVLLGEQWSECVPMLQILCVGGMLYPLHSLNLNILEVQGRSDLFLKLEIIKKIIGIGPLLLGIFLNISWMLIGSVVVGFISYYLNAYYSGPLLNYSIKEQIKDILPGFLVAILMFFCVWALSFIPINRFVILLLQLLVGLVIVVSLCEFFKLPEYFEIKGIAMLYVGRILKHGSN